MSNDTENLKPTKYIGTKRVFAYPMNRADYNKLRGWELPKDENGADEGYLVEYIEGGEPNTKQFKGYVSWSPKEVFKKAYKVNETHVDRLLIEANELKEKVNALHSFVHDNKAVFPKLSTKEKGLLFAQLDLMERYLIVLNERISIS